MIVTNGDPLEIVTQVKKLFIGGEDISLDTNQTLLYQKFLQRPQRRRTGNPARPADTIVCPPQKQFGPVMPARNAV